MTVESKPITPATEGQYRQLAHVAAAIARRVVPTHRGMEEALKRGNTIQRELAPVLGRLSGDPTAPPRVKVAPASDGWNQEHIRIPRLDAQATFLRRAFPDFRVHYPVHDYTAYSPDYNGVVLLPLLKSFGEAYGIDDPYGKPEAAAIVVLEVMRARRGSNMTDREIAEEVRGKMRIGGGLDKLRELEAKHIEQGQTCMAYPTNFGAAYADLSKDHVRWTAGKCGQLPLGAFHVGIILLLFPQLLIGFGDLRLLCSGDDWDFKGEGEWQHTPEYWATWHGEVGLVQSYDGGVERGFHYGSPVIQIEEM